MLRITGYSDKYSVCPGDNIKFYINSENEEVYEAQLVRLIHGDTNPEGPGYKEEEISASCNKNYPGRNQKIHGGGYIIVPQDERFNLESFTMQCYIFPTLPGAPDKGRQAIMGKWNEQTQCGYGMFVDKKGCLQVRIGDGSGQVMKISSDKKLLRKVWYLAAVSYDARTGKVTLFQEPCVTPTNGGLGQGILNPAEETTAIVETVNSMRPGVDDSPFLMAASTWEERSGRTIFGAHFKEANEPIELPVQTRGTYNGKIDRPRLSRRALSKAEIEALARGYKYCHPDVRNDVVGAWDFHANITKNIASTHIVDTSTNRLHGFIVNLPCRGMTGYNWTGDEIVYHHKPEEYGAIHFHDTDIDDARWDVDVEFEIPHLKTGIYALRLRIGGLDSPETEDYIPFVIRPPRGTTTSKLCFILPTNAYMAYSNDNLATNCVVAELLAGKVPVMNASDLYLNEHREYGQSTYSLHSDGSGVCYSSRLRPILNMRPKYRHWLSPSLWQLNGDLHLTDWLEEKGLDFDVHTDEDLDREGVALLNKYRCVLTGSHPEYTSENMFSAYERYQQEGGRWIYLGANGFYWISQYHPDNSNVIEVRKGEAGTRAWTANPGEYNNAFDGKFGGMWRARGRIPSKLCGLTFTAYGFDVSSYYVRDKDSELPETSWIMEGVGNGERIGDFGLVGGGAAGLELDRYDIEFGTPHDAYLLAHSEAHTNLMLQVNEEIHFSVRGYHGGGTENPMVRADMVYYKTPNGGATFAPGSLSWCGSLSHNNYNNNVSRITENAIRGFLKDGDLP